MFYKIEEEMGYWNTSLRVAFPDGTIISKDNKIDRDGWFWSDKPPTEYTEWLESNEEEDLV
tara:strand:- start:610 stop:792 length:183 start_codon:yes stop_codon:yes gene_type:complete